MERDDAEGGPEATSASGENAILSPGDGVEIADNTPTVEGTECVERHVSIQHTHSESSDIFTMDGANGTETVQVSVESVVTVVSEEHTGPGPVSNEPIQNDHPPSLEEPPEHSFVTEHIGSTHPSPDENAHSQISDKIEPADETVKSSHLIQSQFTENVLKERPPLQENIHFNHSHTSEVHYVQSSIENAQSTQSVEDVITEYSSTQENIQPNHSFSTETVVEIHQSFNSSNGTVHLVVSENADFHSEGNSYPSQDIVVPPVESVHSIHSSFDSFVTPSAPISVENVQVVDSSPAETNGVESLSTQEQGENSDPAPLSEGSETTNDDGSANRQMLYELMLSRPLTTKELIDTLERKMSDAPEVDEILADLHCEQSDEADTSKMSASDSKTTEDLLAILEDDDVVTESETKKGEVKKRRSRHKVVDPELETQMALKQLKELPSKAKKHHRIVDVNIPKKHDKSINKTESPTKQKLDSVVQEDDTNTNKNQSDESPTKKDTLSFISEDWSDDEVPENNRISKNSSVIHNESSKNESIDAMNGDESLPIEASDDSVAKRAPRVIKKKIIWDPDDTHAGVSDKKLQRKELPESRRRPLEETEVSPEKKTEISASPVRKKKMTEVDKLLMDEGAINMMYSLERSQNNIDVPEINLKPNKRSMISIRKERRNLLNKAKIIKNTVIKETKTEKSPIGTKKFRARKEINEKTKRKSIMSPMPSEDSMCDESRIIRRHSSSSFSSECFNPASPPLTEIPIAAKASVENLTNGTGDMRVKSAKVVKNNMIQKKLNISNKNVKTKKNHAILKNVFKGVGVTPKIKNAAYTQLSLHHTDGVLHVILKPTMNIEGLFDAKVLEELSTAISHASKANTRVLVITSDDGRMCGGMDLRSVVHPQVALQKTNANQLLLNLSGLISEICKYKGILITGVDGACCGLGVTLLTLADLAIASDKATFCIAPASRRHLPPEGTVLLTVNQSIPAQLVREMIFCGRKLTAAEALQRGLIARMIWPDRFVEELLEVAKDVATYPQQALEITKNILRHNELKKVKEAIKEESALLSNFWCSPEGQKHIQKAYAHL